MPSGTYETLKADKKLRIDNQYYLKNIKVNFSYTTVLEFVLSIKEIINQISSSDITRIRDYILDEKNNAKNK